MSVPGIRVPLIIVTAITPFALNAAPQLLAQSQLCIECLTGGGVQCCLATLQGTPRPFAAVAML
jgi:hypothetical protein